MYINTKQVTPIKQITPIDFKYTVEKKNRLCTCKALNPVLQTARICGFLPATWSHDETTTCELKTSSFWMVYTIVLYVLYIFQNSTSVDYASLLEKKFLLVMLNDITDAIYAIYTLLLMFTNFLRYKKWIKTFNEFTLLIKDGLFCQSAMKTVLFAQYCAIGSLVFIVLLQSGVLTYVHFSQNYSTNFTISFFIKIMSQNIPFVFYLLFYSIISLLLGILACFEKLTISSLKYTPVHPMKGIDCTNNERSFMGLIRYKLCKGEHVPSYRMSKLSAPELVEHLRIVHEEISLISYAFNSCMNPQFLFHTVAELIVLIIHWYAVIAYMVYNFKSPFAKTVQVLNCLFVVMHTFGLFFFLKNAQALKNMIQGYTNFLLEFSTRITTQEEHQQVRIFIEKIKNHRPFTASGVFTIDLGIAGPIAANILTYVLVALQFEIPQE